MNTDQNRTLGGCTTLDEKLSLLATWRRTNEINIYQYRWFTNKWINRYKKEILSPTPVQHQDIELTRMNNELRQKIAFRVLFPTLYLDSPSKAKFTKCLETGSAYRHQENELLALALRCPHENLAEIAGEYVAAHRVKKLPMGASHSLWRTVWNDEYVPMDAIRIMMPQTDETSILTNCFGKVFLSELYPLVKVHKEREVFRRDAALSREETALAEKRIRAFDKLLTKTKEILSQE
ncbi:MAG: hypothetical protein SOU80_07025 [Alphaproteobacteria bacterium]|nr:hypothetical protein [Alphaproteobacteria bacterium]